MITLGIIEVVEESEWKSLMVINIKKDEMISICVDYRDLNTVCGIDPFTTPFAKEILEGLARIDIYYFINGFSRYHKVRITQ